MIPPPYREDPLSALQFDVTARLAAVPETVDIDWAGLERIFRSLAPGEAHLLDAPHNPHQEEGLMAALMDACLREQKLAASPPPDAALSAIEAALIAGIRWDGRRTDYDTQAPDVIREHVYNERLNLPLLRLGTLGRNPVTDDLALKLVALLLRYGFNPDLPMDHLDASSETNPESPTWRSLFCEEIPETVPLFARFDAEQWANQWANPSPSARGRFRL